MTQEELLQKLEELAGHWRVEEKIYRERSGLTHAVGISNWHEGLADGNKLCANDLGKLIGEAKAAKVFEDLAALVQDVVKEGVRAISAHVFDEARAAGGRVNVRCDKTLILQSDHAEPGSECYYMAWCDLAKGHKGDHQETRLGWMIRWERKRRRGNEATP